MAEYDTARTDDFQNDPLSIDPYNMARWGIKFQDSDYWQGRANEYIETFGYSTWANNGDTPIFWQTWVDTYYNVPMSTEPRYERLPDWQYELLVQDDLYWSAMPHSIQTDPDQSMRLELLIAANHA